MGAISTEEKVFLYYKVKSREGLDIVSTRALLQSGRNNGCFAGEGVMTVMHHPFPINNIHNYINFLLQERKYFTCIGMPIGIN